ncbi:MAG TPA: serine/threonine protein phosphatase [Verrucomicrobiae bacterium]|nr:serine/threonine protein phosphatase [Verrucomicrobiae bacterium]
MPHSGIRPGWEFTSQSSFPMARHWTILGADWDWFRMLKVKDTLRATVHLTFDGQVIKAYHGPNAGERFDNEVRVLRHLEARGCNFVPRLLEADREKMRIVTTNCGTRVERIDDQRVKELFGELEQFGVRHDDPDIRNVTYRQSDGRFCLIDFEFATILPGFE